MDAPTTVSLVAQPPRRPLAERPAVLGALLVVAIVVAFLPGVVGEFVWDDVPLIRSNVYVRELSRIGEALTHDFWHVSAQLDQGGGFSGRYYRPVVTLAYALQFRVFGDQPAGFHLVNLALHAACSLLAFGWIRRRLGGSQAAILPALLGAALFALHPSRPESVSWISGSTDLWMSLWILLGLRAWDRGDSPGDVLRAALFFALAGLSKEAAVVVPVLLAADLLLLPSARDDRRPRWRALGVVASATAVVVVARMVVLHGVIPPNTRELVGTMPARVLSTIGHYAAAVAWPWRPSVQLALQRSDRHGLPLYDHWSVVVGVVVVVSLLAVALRAWRDPRWRPWAADSLWLAIALAPTMNIVPMGMKVLVAMRFLYLPLLGAAALTARALHAAGPTRVRAPVIGAALVALVAFGAVTTQHASHFASEDDLWSHELRLNPCNHYVLGQVSNLQLQRRQWQQVPPTLQRIYQCSMMHGDGNSAVTAMIHTAQFLLWTSPDRDQQTLVAVRNFLDAFVTASSGEARLVTRTSRMAFPLRPHEAPLRRAQRLEASRAFAYFRTWRFEEAERQLRAVVVDPHAFTARRYLAMTLAAQERWDESLAILDGLTRDSASAPEAAPLRRRLTEARALVVAAGDDPLLRPVARAHLFTALGLSEQARRQVQHLLSASPDRCEPVEALALAEIEDRRLDVASELLAGARVRFPSEGPRWNALARSLIAAADR